MNLSFAINAILFSLAARKAAADHSYEVWASDQSNTAPDQENLGVKGSFLWIWDSEDIQTQLNGGPDAVSLPCTPGATQGPCDMLEVFPPALQEYDENGETGNTLGGLPSFGRLHGVIEDPQNRYVNANFFVRGGAYVGVIDTSTKEAIAMFRTTKFNYGPSDSDRSIHMSFWNKDGSAIIIANLHGKALERINVERAPDGTITKLSFDKGASLGLGKSQTVAEPATFFQGKNAFGRDLLGEITGEYSADGLNDLTPNGVCKENGCNSGPDGAMGGRANNLPICPNPSSRNDLVYTTLAGGGLFVVDTFATPMKILGEYGRNVIYGAGCAGAEAQGKMYTNSGVSASGAGADQSMFALWQLDDDDYLISNANAENSPMPVVVFEDEGNTATGGNLNGEATDGSGQIPGTTTRRDSHGAATTVDQNFVHVVDRIQNVVEAFDVRNFKRYTYDLTSGSGKNGLKGVAGPCLAKSVMDDSSLPVNDPAPDLTEVTPDGKYLMIAFRGPAPVTVPHGAQGSCPGVGIVQISPNGKFGRLVDVLRTSNTTPDLVSPVTPGGVSYSGTERSDVHGAIVVLKRSSV